MTNDTEARIWFAGANDRAQGIVAPLADSPPPGAPGYGEITVEHQGSTDTLVFWFGAIGPDGLMQPPRATAPIPTGLLFDLLIRRPKPPAEAITAEPFGSLAEHIEARTVELRGLLDRANAEGGDK